MDRFKNHFRILLIIAICLLAWAIKTSPGFAAPGSAPSFAQLPTSFTYDGRVGLADGTYDLRFQLWNAVSNGSLVGSSNPQIREDIPVRALDFRVSLDFGASAFTGEERWIEVAQRAADSTGGFTVLGRFPLRPVPYALSLRPGAAITGSTPNPGAVLHATNTGAGAGLWGYATSGAGVYGRSTTGNGVAGLHAGTTGNAAGVQGLTASTAMTATGVLGQVSPTATGRYSAGVRGINNGTGGDGVGVWGAHAGTGSGVKGTSARGYAGEFVSDNYRGLYVKGAVDRYAAYIDGQLYASNSVSIATNAYVYGDLIVSGTCQGCTTAYPAQNSGTTTIAVGDLVAAAGVVVDPVRKQPVLLVRRAGQGNDAVIGVAASALAPAAKAEHGDQPTTPFVPVAGEAKPNGYVHVVTQGLVQLRVDNYAIQIGEYVVAGVDGRATKSANGERIAKVLSAPDAKGLVWALVDGN